MQNLDARVSYTAPEVRVCRFIYITPVGDE
jgi:hypothetical protein